MRYYYVHCDIDSHRLTQELVPIQNLTISDFVLLLFSAEIEMKYQEIMKQSGILTINDVVSYCF